LTVGQEIAVGVVGKASRAEIESAMNARNLLVRERGGQKIATTPEVLAEEKRMLDFARSGRGVSARLGEGGLHGNSAGRTIDEYTFRRQDLSDGQRREVLHVLGSRDRVTVFQRLTRHRVPWIMEVDQGAKFGARDNVPVIYLIEW
jgi:hypothetical protein